MRAEDRVSTPPVVPLQYGRSAGALPLVHVEFGQVPASPVNSVPPMPVTSGIAAGISTAKPCVADVTWKSQSAAPESPEEEMTVWPCAFACFAHLCFFRIGRPPRSDSQFP